MIPQRLAVAGMVSILTEHFRRVCTLTLLVARKETMVLEGQKYKSDRES